MIDNLNQIQLNLFDPSAIGYDGIFCGIEVSGITPTQGLNLFDPSAIEYDGIVSMHSIAGGINEVIARSCFNIGVF